jgi:hypothetical protein
VSAGVGNRRMARYEKNSEISGGRALLLSRESRSDDDLRIDRDANPG